MVFNSINDFRTRATEQDMKDLEAFIKQQSKKQKHFQMKFTNFRTHRLQKFCENMGI